MPNRPQLENKVAIVTGGAAGLGFSIAETFVSQGAKVFIADVDEAAGNQSVENIGPAAAAFQRVDVTSEEDVKACVSACVEKFGKIDCLVNNAGVVGPWGPLEEIDIAAVEKMFQINISGCVIFTKYAIPALEVSGGGSIINMSGTAAESVRGAALQMGYNLSKAAVNQLTRCCAFELGAKNIRVNAIQPGFMASKILPKKFGMDEESAEKVMPALKQFFAQLQPLNVTGEPQDIADTATFLASDASRFVSGQIISVDGAMMLDYAGLSTDDWLAGVNRALGLQQ